MDTQGMASSSQTLSMHVKLNFVPELRGFTPRHDVNLSGFVALDEKHQTPLIVSLEERIIRKYVTHYRASVVLR